MGTENLRGAKFSYDCKDFKLASQGTPCVVSGGVEKGYFRIFFSGGGDLQAGKSLPQEACRPGNNQKAGQ